MRNLLLIGLLFSNAVCSAQTSDPFYEKLLAKHRQGDHVAVLKKAEGLMEDDKTKKDPDPYLLAAMCHLSLYRSDDPKLKESNKGGVREALKLAAKAASKDKEGALLAQHPEFLNDLRKEGVTLASVHVADADYRKANGIFKQILAFAPQDDNVRMAKAVTDIRMNYAPEGERLMAEALPRLDSAYRDLAYVPDPISAPLLRDAFLYCIDHLKMTGQIEAAKNAAFVARIIYPLDEDIKFKAESLK
jgi:hypothetical protein